MQKNIPSVIKKSVFVSKISKVNAKIVQNVIKEVINTTFGLVSRQINEIIYANDRKYVIKSKYFKTPYLNISSKNTDATGIANVTKEIRNSSHILFFWNSKYRSVAIDM